VKKTFWEMRFMPFRGWKLSVQDIIESIEAVEGYVEGMTFEQFLRDARTIDAVVRRFTIIGEASNHIPEEICHRNPDIPWADMRVMSNFVVHEYFGVDEKTLWDTIHENLPGVAKSLQRMLKQEAG